MSRDVVLVLIGVALTLVAICILDAVRYYRGSGP